MTDLEKPSFTRGPLPRIPAILVLVLGLATMIGLMFRVPAFTGILPHFAPMEFNTGLCMALIALATLAKDSPRLGRFLAFTVLLLSGVTLIQYPLALNFGIDRWFLNLASAPGGAHPGRMTPLSALCFMLLSFALWLGSERSWRQHQRTLLLDQKVRRSRENLSSMRRELGIEREKSHLGASALGFGLLVWKYRSSPYLELDGALRQLLGVEGETGSRSLEDFLTLIDPEDRRDFAAKTNPDSLDGQVSFKGDFRLAGTAGAPRWIAYQCRVFDRDKTEEIRLCGVFWDATLEKKRTLQLARQSEHLQQQKAFIREVFDSTPTHMVVVDENLNAVMTNHAFLRFAEINGFPEDFSWQTTPMHAWVSEFYRTPGADGLQRVLDAVTQVQSGLAADFGEIVACTVGDEPVWLHVHVVPLRSEARRVILFHLDVTDSVLAERRARIAQARFDALFRSMDEGVVVFDLADGRIQECNSAFRAKLGYEKGELEGRNIWELTPTGWHPLERVILVGPLMERGSTGEYEKEFYCSDGSRLPVAISLWLPSSGNAPGKTAWALVRDLSARKSEERKRQKLVDDLERSNRDLNHFAYIASHDLQEPLRKVQAFASLLEAELGTALEIGEARHFMDRILAATGHMRELISDLLTFARVDHGEFVAKQIFLEPILERAWKDVGQEGIPLDTIDCDRTMFGHEVMLFRLFQNLFSNCVKYRNMDRDLEVKVTATVVDEGLHIAVADNGIGFDAEYADKIFQPFQRLKMRKDVVGTGIGLAICRKIVERHGGRIAATGVLGEGCTMHLFFPNEKEPHHGRDHRTQDKRHVLNG
ncbi:PAS domain S-box protein [Sulfidibacter corallicola]|uniref:histidine kinase n=1 Tax=Sulfidibacter corallicola TaxID=2818388 RepID=A0A8A4TLY1_SULCO|nr:ATP-binding protein [Sulfidibacter corallicola]QTD50573.1 PAS domain S-box protein [Sulfidibacter corallicola]